MILTRDVSDILLTELKRRRAVLADMGYTVTVNGGAYHWINFMSRHKAARYVAFGQTDDLFELVVSDVDREDIAVIVMRYYGDTSIVALVNSGRLWWGPMTAWDRSCGAILPPEASAIDGRILHQGGLVVLPEHRGKGIGGHLAHMIRLIGFRTFDCEHATGLEPVDQINAEMHKRVYGYERAYPCANGLDIRGKGPESMWLTHVSRAEIVARLRPEQ